MFRIVRSFLELLLFGCVVAIASPLLFWLGRSAVKGRGEMVVDSDLLADDPGVDVDGDE